jgi:hypothetical protein
MAEGSAEIARDRLVLRAACLEPGRVSVMSAGEFDALVGSQPWSYTRRWHYAWHQHAVCERGTG